MTWSAIPAVTGCLQGIGTMLPAEMSTPHLSWGGAAWLCPPFSLTRVQSNRLFCLFCIPFLPIAFVPYPGIGPEQRDLV